jgi:hypothetical protein
MNLPAIAPSETGESPQAGAPTPSFVDVLIGSALGLLAGSFIASLLLGLGLALLGQGDVSERMQGLMGGMAMTVLAVPIGLLPVLLYGAPLYWLLARLQLADRLTVTLVGLAPGLYTVAMDPELGWLALLFGGYGLCVAQATHALLRNHRR